MPWVDVLYSRERPRSRCGSRSRQSSCSSRRGRRARATWGTPAKPWSSGSWWEHKALRIRFIVENGMDRISGLKLYPVSNEISHSDTYFQIFNVRLDIWPDKMFTVRYLVSIRIFGIRPDIIKCPALYGHPTIQAEPDPRTLKSAFLHKYYYYQ